MEMKDNNSKDVKGAEAIVIHNGNILLGMQRQKRWYTLEKEEKAAIIKTIGGQIEEKDNNNSKNTPIREFFEEIKGIEKNDILLSDNPIFTKKIMMKDLNIFEKNSNLNMEADFYLLELQSKKNVNPNDLPALFEIPIKDFLNMNLHQKENLS